MTRRIWWAAGALALLAGACGDDDDDGGGADSDDPYVQALTESMDDQDESDLPLDADQADCLAPRFVEILDIILRDEIGHVAIGDQWFRAECAARGVNAEAEYLRLIDFFEAPPPRPPFNVPARLQAGFTEAELETLASRQRRPSDRQS